MPEGSPSVLIIRLDAIGDALALTPLLAALRRHAVPLTSSCGRTTPASFRAARCETMTIARFELRSSAKSNLAAIERLGRELRDRAYTHVLVATEDPGGYRLARAVGAPVRIGFADPWGKPFKALWSRRLLTRQSIAAPAWIGAGRTSAKCSFALGSALTGPKGPTRDVGELRPLVLEREPAPDERIAVQITDKWERLGLSIADVVDLVRRLASTGELHLLRHDAKRSSRKGSPTQPDSP